MSDAIRNLFFVAASADGAIAPEEISTAANAARERNCRFLALSPTLSNPIRSRGSIWCQSSFRDQARALLARSPSLEAAASLGRSRSFLLEDPQNLLQSLPD